MLAANKISSTKSSDELIEKSGNLKGKKLSKSQKSVKPGKKLSKSGNLPNFNAKKNISSFLTLEGRVALNYLWLIFTKAPIF